MVNQISQHATAIAVSLLFLILFFGTGKAWGQTATSTWALTNNANVVISGNISSGAISIGSGISNLTFSGTGANSTNWESATSINLNDYYEFTISPLSGYILTIDDIRFNHERSKDNGANNGGPIVGSVYYSTNGFSSSIQIGSNYTVNASSTSFSASGLSINVPEGSTLTFRIYGWNSENSNGRYSILNLVLSGSTILAAPPSCTTSISPSNGEVGFAVDGILSWNAVSGAIGYKIYFGTDASATNIENGTDLGNVTSYTPSVNLDFLTDYYWQVVPYNSYGNASGCSTWSFTTADISYCSAGSTAYNLYESITNVTFAGINNTSPVSKTAGYTDYTSLVSPGNVSQGQNYQISISNEFLIEEGFGGYCKVYIDLDQNGIFDSSSELIFGSAYINNTTMTGTITIPITALVGLTRMRVVIEGDADSNFALPCGDFAWGEVEDYSINVLAPCNVIAQNVTGGGSYCSDDAGVAVGLDDSETGVTYTLYRDGTSTGISVAGSGSALAFGNQTVAGTYTVVGHNDTEDCDVDMNGSAVVVVNPSPTLTSINQVADICDGSPVTINLTGLVASSTFTLAYSINGNPQTPVTSIIADGSGNSSFSTSNLTVSDDGKTLEITNIAITSSSPNCAQSFSGISTSISVLPTEVSVSISANPSGSVCPGTTVTYTATPTNGGTAPSYQWKVNGTNVGTDSNTFSYEPADGDEISCVLTSNSPCATSSASVPILFFSFDDDTKPIIDSDFGLDAISVDPGAQYNIGALAPGPASSSTQGIDLTFSGSEPELNFEGLEYSVDYRRGEGQGEMFTRGTYLIITAGSNFSVSYRISDGAGSYTTVSSGNIWAIPDDNIFHNYRFLYNPQDGIGRLIVDGDEKWQSSPTPGQPLYWDGASGNNLLVGRIVDASGTQVPTFDNLSIKAINEKTANDLITAVVNPLLEPTLSSNSPICAGDDAVFTITGTPGNIVTYSGASGLPASPVTIGTGGTVDVTIAGVTSDVTLNLTNVNEGTCNLSLSGVSETITVNPLPTVVANASSTEICAGESVTLTGSGAASYTWDNGVTDGVAFAPAITTTYTVTGTDVNGCENTDQITITVNPLPTPADANIEICADETSTDLTTYNSTVLDGETGTITWYDGDPSASGTILTPATAVNLNNITELWAEVMLTTTECKATIHISVTINPLPATGEIIPD